MCYLEDSAEAVRALIRRCAVETAETIEGGAAVGLAPSVVEKSTFFEIEPFYSGGTARSVFTCSMRVRETYFAENLNTVFDRKVSPGFRIVLGKSG